MWLSNRFVIKSAALGLFLLLGLGLLLPGAAGAEQRSGAQPALPGDSYWAARIYYQDIQTVRRLVGWLEPLEIHPEQGYLTVIVTAEEYAWLAAQDLQAQGMRVEIDLALTQAINRPNVRLPGQVSGIPGFPCYRTVEETYATAEALAAAYPDLVTWEDIGDSWEKTQPEGEAGYDLKVLRLTNAAIPGPKAKLFVMASVHALEYTPAELATRFAENLLDQYGEDADAAWILDYHEVHLLLQANPDGRKKAEAGLFWRKNTNANYCTANPSQWGADLNRNFEFQWNCCGGGSNDPCSAVYRGAAAASEPEVQAIQAYLRQQFFDHKGPALTDPVADTTSGIFVDLHSAGGLVIWPWGFAVDLAPNGVALTTLGRKMAYFDGYYPKQIAQLYPADGSTVDFAYGDLGLAAFGIELGSAQKEDCAAFETDTLVDNLPVLKYLARAAGAPYLAPSGPDVLSLTAAPVGGLYQNYFELTAAADDSRYSQANGIEAAQNIAAAEFYIDAPPWITTTVPLTGTFSALDGVFDQSFEQLAAGLDAAGLPAGRHIVFVRARDAAGNWGALSAVFLTVQRFVFLPALFFP